MDAVQPTLAGGSTATPTSNPGASVQYDPSNPFSVGVSGTGDFSGAEMNSAQGIPAPVPDVSTISSSSLAPATPLSYSTPNPVPIPSVQSLETQATPPLTETGPEEQESSLSTQLQSLNDELIGKSADQTTENNNAGIPGLQQTQNDLSTQLSSLKSEAAAIPDQLQLAATGRGITAGGLAPVQTAALRNNSIQALGVSAMLDATNGLLASAQTKANAAVAAKYDPIQEEINAATANLKLIQNDPNTTLADKNRAQAQLDVQNAKAAQLVTAKQNATDVLNAAITAAKNGADASTLQKIQAAPDGATALQIATAAGYGTSDVNDLVTKYPDAGIEPGDTLQQAQQKVMASPTYTMAQKTQMLDIATKEQALATAAANSSPATIGTAVQSLSDFNGTKYYTPTDIQGMDAKTKQAFVTAATAAGAKPLSAKDGDAISSINSAQSDLSSFSNYIQGASDGSAGITLPTNWLGQPQQYANVKFNQFLQTNGQLAAYSSWAAQIPTLLSALKGAGSGSGGSSRLFGTIETLLPADTDTLPTALTKLQTINTILTNGANSIMGIDGGSSGNTYNGVTLPGTSSNSGSTYNGITLPN